MKLPEKIYEDLKEGVAVLAESLKVPAEKLVEILIKQAYIDSWISIAISIVLFFIFIISLIATIWSASEDLIEELIVILGIFTAVLLGAFMAYTISSMSEIITGFTNPEYKALMDVLSRLK